MTERVLAIKSSKRGVAKVLNSGGHTHYVHWVPNGNGRIVTFTCHGYDSALRRAENLTEMKIVGKPIPTILEIAKTAVSIEAGAIEGMELGDERKLREARLKLWKSSIVRAEAGHKGGRTRKKKHPNLPLRQEAAC